MKISIGIPTLGKPHLTRLPSGDTLLENMLIGLNFHWQRSIEATLPGEITHSDDSVYTIINHVDMEDYLECVVGSEMNPAAPAEFLKAHAIISRSWAAGKVLGSHPAADEGKINTPEQFISWEDTGDHQGFNVCSDDHCQRYQGRQPIPDKVRDAIRATSGIVLTTSGGKLVDARFSKCCGGRTEIFSTCWQNREEECLESFEDPWCDLSELSTVNRERVLSTILKDYDLDNGGGYRWQTGISKIEIKKNLKDKFGIDIGDILEMKVARRGPSGRANLLQLIGSSRTIMLGKELMIRRLLSDTHLFSSWIDICTAGDGFLIKGRGWGHGVGLCQIGAARMALEGYSAADILQFYYPGSRLKNLNIES